MGFLTIGYGHLLKLTPGEEPPQSITQEEAEMYLTADLSEAEYLLFKTFPWMGELDDRRFCVMQNMCFNLGIAGLSKFKKMLAALEDEDYKAAAEEMLDSLWAKQVGDRAKRLAEQMRTGVWQ
jgi:lysozyme